ncbi:MAG: ankyrin repeat domain-containing protein [Proteobacteria bacterium]|nr:ankyrin repeat domain-containing protein [Pseudomonadota bacterium]
MNDKLKTILNTTPFEADKALQLIAEGADVDTTNDRGQSAIAIAARNGQLDIVKTLVQQKANIDAKDRMDKTPLHWAIIGEKPECALWLIENGANIHIKTHIDTLPRDTADVDQGGMSALEFAAIMQQNQVLEALIAKRAKVDDIHDYAWKKILDDQKAATLKLLLKSGANLQYQIGVMRPITVIEYAKQTGGAVNDLIQAHIQVQQDFFKALSQQDKKVALDMIAQPDFSANYRDENNQTPLHWAAAKRREDVVQALLKARAKINATDKDGNTPLHIAGSNENSAIYRILVEHGAAVMPQNNGGKTPAFTTIDGGLRTLSSTSERRTRLERAIIKGDAELMEVMLEDIWQENEPLIVLNDLFSYTEHNHGILTKQKATAKQIDAMQVVISKCSTGDADLSYEILTKAIEYRQTDLIPILLHAKVSVNGQDNNSFPLYHAVSNIDLPGVKALLEHGANVNSKYNEYYYDVSCLKRALSKLSNALDDKNKVDCIEICKLLLASGASITSDLITNVAPSSHWQEVKAIFQPYIKDDNLQQAVIKRDLLEELCKEAINIDAIENLIFTGKIDIHAEYARSRLILHMVALYGHTAGIEYLLAKQANIHAVDGDNNTALHHAVDANKVPIVKYLLDHGANASATNKYKCTPLHNADNTEIIDLLLKHGANINALGLYEEKEQTPLQRAIERNSNSIALYFISKGADVKIEYLYHGKNVEGQDHTYHNSTLCLAYVNGKGDLQLIEALLAGGIDTSSLGSMWDSVIKYSRVDVAQLLLKYNANLWCSSYILDKVSIPEYAKQKGGAVNDLIQAHIKRHQGFFKALTQQEKQVALDMIAQPDFSANYQNENNQTPLHWAASFGRLDVMQALIASGANIKTQDKDGNTPLHWAVASGNTGAVKFLLDQGVEINVKDKDGNTPLHQAVKEKQPKMIELLVEEGGNQNIKNKAYLSPQELIQKIPESEPDPYAKARRAMRDATKNHGYELSQAVIDGKNPQLIKRLLQRYSDQEIATALCGFLHSRDFTITAPNYPQQLEAFITILQECPQKGYQDASGDTFMHLVSTSQHDARLIKAMVAQGVPVNEPNEMGVLAIEKLLNRSVVNEAAICALIDADSELGPLVDINGKPDWVVRSLAEKKGLNTVLQKLKEAGISRPDSSRVTSQDIKPALQKQLIDELKKIPVVKDRITNIIDQLSAIPITNNADLVNEEKAVFNYYIKGQDGEMPEWQTPIYYAIKSGDFGVVRMLLNRGSSLNILDKDGQTILGARELMELNDTALLNEQDLEKRKDRERIKKSLAWRIEATKQLYNAIAYYSDRGFQIDKGVQLKNQIAGHRRTVLSDIQFWLKNGADPNGNIASSTNKLEYPAALHQLMHNRVPQDFAISIAQILIKNGANINQRNKDGAPPLHTAIQNGKTELADYLIQSGANPGYRTNNGHTILHAEALQGKGKYLPIAIKAGIKVNEPDNNDVLVFAAMAGQKEFVEALLKSGANPNAQLSQSQNSALYGAVRRYPNDNGVIDLLLQHGANVNLKCENGQTALHAATSCVDLHFELVGKLLAAPKLDVKAAVEAIDDNGNTPLHRLAMNSQGFWKIESFDILKSKGADINAKNKQGFTPLDLAIIHVCEALAAHMKENGCTSNHQAIRESNIIKRTQELHELILSIKSTEAIPNKKIEELIEKGASTNAKGENGEKALHVVCKNKNISDERTQQLVELLLQHEAEIDQTGSSYKVTPLQHAIENNKPLTAHYLIENGANGKATDSNGQTTLHFAVRSGNTELMQLALDNGASLEEKDTLKRTTLFHAIISGHVASVKWLISKGVDVNARGENNVTAIHCFTAALLSGQLNDITILDLLLGAGADVNAMTPNGTALDMVLSAIGKAKDNAPRAVGNVEFPNILQNTQTQSELLIKKLREYGGKTKKELSAQHISPTTVKLMIAIPVGIAGGAAYLASHYWLSPMLHNMVKEGAISQLKANWAQVGISGGAGLTFALLSLALLWGKEGTKDQEGLAPRQVAGINLAIAPIACATSMMISMIVEQAINEAAWAHTASILINLNLPALLSGGLGAFLIGDNSTDRQYS